MPIECQSRYGQSKRGDATRAEDGEDEEEEEEEVRKGHLVERDGNNYELPLNGAMVM